MADVDSGELPLPSLRRIKGAVETLELLATYYRAAGYDERNISETPASGMRKSSLLRSTIEVLVGTDASTADTEKAPHGKTTTS
jgi:hypothetical protein